jgi:DNA-directed RNA polymerase II subunit RPB1
MTKLNKSGINNNGLNTKSPSKIIGIQFSILSPEEIKKSSVAEITSRDTYINNKPVIGGLFDPRMGILDPGLICPTDGLEYMQTPGYFGHVELARPVFYHQYLTTIIKIIRCCCFKCGKLLLSKEKYKHALDMSPSDRWEFVFDIANTIKSCGESSDDGCGYTQPIKIKKEGLATLLAIWKDAENSEEGKADSTPVSLKLTPEIILKIFKRMSDEDITFMGFSPVFSRPEWMICQVLAIPPPAVRPSVKHDSQQRSEDDISHIIVNIIKSNKILQEKISQNAQANVIDDLTTVLQYYIATLVDNNIPGVASVAQRSGRPLKSIKERINGKTGRVRGNLMGKRVDFSARSVITPDPNISIMELGIPMKIAINITKPIIVNDKNKNFLLKLVQNGPDIYPGAKILEKKNGENISLRYVDRLSVELENGDKVHRHMMDGDYILFNRQPTLHRMSMMGHIAKIMSVGDTFRMNVADTKPYNADFDGDEMNLHMPQDVESETELKMLASVQYQIISPANNKPIIGIFQDNLLGAYRITRENIVFTPRDAMNLLMAYNKIDINSLYGILQTNGNISNFELLTQILPPLTLKYKTKRFTDADNYSTSNNVLEISDGEYIRGQIEKGVLGDSSNGLIHRIYNDFGSMAAVEFIDDLQNIVTEYMKTSSYSVGISDLIANTKTIKAIGDAITSKKIEVKSLIEQAHLGIFENKTGKTNEEEFETRINNILNQAMTQAGKTARESLDKDNRFVGMVNAGSKGSELNISQMIATLGQQNIDGKRIPYGFENRTLPHFNKFDDSPNARGFVESSFISGLTPEELFFHAMGGRMGLIDTAVKTSQTGYIQRRLVKGLEDLKVEYDMTVRNNKGRIVQYSYGEDCIDPLKTESQIIYLVNMSIEDIYAHYKMPSDNINDDIYISHYTEEAISRIKTQKQELTAKCINITKYMIEQRDNIISHVFKNKDSAKAHLPVAFKYIIDNIKGQLLKYPNLKIDITPLEAFEMIDDTMNILMTNVYIPPTELFKTLYYYYLSPTHLLTIYKFNKSSLTLLLNTIVLRYQQSIIAPGEMVGLVAAQSIGEPTTQMTLNTFHFAGVASKSNVTRGVPRIEEILSLSNNPKNPSCTIYLKKEKESEQKNAQDVMYTIEHTTLREIVNSIQICFDPDDKNTLIEEDRILLEQYNNFEEMMEDCFDESEDSPKSKWIVRMELNIEIMLDKNITMDDIHFAIKNYVDAGVSCVYSDYNSDKIIFRIRQSNILKKKHLISKGSSLDQSDEIYLLQAFQDSILDNMILRGIKNIKKVIPRKITDNIDEQEGSFVKNEIWILDTIGTNLMDILALDYIDPYRTITNDIQEIYKVLGIEAARQAIFNEITDAIEFDGAYINYHHLSILCDRMTTNDGMTSIFRHGINNDDIGPIAKASFEETPEMFLRAAKHAELDIMRGISANVMCGQEGFFGTSAFQVMLDMDKLQEFNAINVDTINENSQDIIDSSFSIESQNTPCSDIKLNITSNSDNIKIVDLGINNSDYNPGF